MFRFSTARLNKKIRRHSGWVYPDSTIRMPKKWIIDNCLEPQPYYDDWLERRDGMRDYLGDWKKIKKVEHKCCRCPDMDLFEKERLVLRLLGITPYLCNICDSRARMNKKQKRLLEIRKARKQKVLYSTFY